MEIGYIEMNSISPAKCVQFIINKYFFRLKLVKLKNSDRLKLFLGPVNMNYIVLITVTM